MVMAMPALSYVASLILGMVAMMAYGTSADAGETARYAALIVDVNSAKVLFERNAHQPRYPASLTKMMTLYMVFEALERRRLTLGQRLRVSKQAAQRPPTNLKLKPGSTLTVKEAILALITRSANDAATVVAEALAGTESNFARQMTQKARTLGMRETTFRNASGLADPLQVTTAWDMYKLATALQRRFPKYYRYFSVTHFYFRDAVYHNHNRLLGDYPGVDGIKTGYISASGYNLVTSVRRGGRQIIGIIFGGNTASQRDHEMRILLDNGFAQLGIGDSLAQVTDEDKDTIATSFDVHNLDPLNLVSQSGTSAPPTLDQQYTWRLQVGAFSRFNIAKHQLSRAIEAVPDRLSQARVVIVPLLKSGRILYRAYFKDLSEEEAGTVCRRLKQKRIDCLVLPPSI